MVKDIQLFTHKQYSKMLHRGDTYHNKYYHTINITVGFIIGCIIDNLIPLTFGLPIKLLKGYGKSFYSAEIKHKYFYKILNIKFIGGFFKGFLN